MDFLRRKGSPLYLQIQEFLEKQIRSGALRNKRLPPVRTMATEFKVNPNTVQRAYHELGRNGITTGQVGKGTFLTTTSSGLKQQGRRELLRKAIDHSLEEALALEFTLQEFEETVREYIREKQEIIRHIKLVFIECNTEQLTYFTEHLKMEPQAGTIPVLLSDLRTRKTEALSHVKQADIIVTSFYHLDEVREQFNSLRKPVMGINLEPEIATLIEIAKIPSDKTVGIVTSSESFRKEIRGILKNAGIQFKRVLETNSKKTADIRRIASKCDAILVSPHQKDTVAELAGPWVKIIEFIFTPDKTSVNNLKLAFLEIKKNLTYS